MPRGEQLLLERSSPTNNRNNYDLTVWRYNSNGTLDSNFNGSGYLVHGGLLTGQDKGGYSDVCVWKVHPDGSLDSTFNKNGVYCKGNIAGGSQDDIAYGLALYGQKRIVLTGQSFNGTRKDMFVMVLK